MPISPDDVVRLSCPVSEFYSAITYAYHVLTHQDANPSVVQYDPLHDFTKLLLDETAERLVLAWLQAQGKFAETAIEKGSSVPDLSHEIWVSDIRGVKVKASVQTFLSTNKSVIEEILQTHWFSMNTDKVCGINFSVVFWLQLKEKPRIQLPSLRQVALMGWISDKNLRELGNIKGAGAEKRNSIKMAELRTLHELLQFLV